MNKNNSSLSQVVASTKKPLPLRIGSLFVILIVLFYLAPLLAAAARSDPSRLTDYLYLYSSTFYTIIVLGIITLYKNGPSLLQDHFSLWMVVFGCFSAASQGGEHDTVYKLFLILLGFRLSFHIFVNRKEIKVPELNSLFIGLLWSVVTITIIGLLLYFLGSVRVTLPSNWLPNLLNTLLYQISFVTIIEEAFFRGILFSLLVLNDYQEDRALIIQGLLFWGSHYLQIGANPALFFIAVPLLTLSTTLIFKEYKMLYLSVIVHTLVNVFGPVLIALL